MPDEAGIPKSRPNPLGIRPIRESQPEYESKEKPSKSECDCRQGISPNAGKPEHQLGVVSFLLDQRSYYLVLTETASRNAVSFRGLSARLNPNNIFESKVLNFHIKGPLIEMIADLGDFQELEISGSVFPLDQPGAPAAPGAAPVPQGAFQARVHVLLTPWLSCDGLSPHGALLWLKTSQHEVKVTLADFRSGKTIWESIATTAIALSCLIMGETALVTGGKVKGKVTVDLPKHQIVMEGEASTGPGHPEPHRS
jgi:hypothetical protein